MGFEKVIQDYSKKMAPVCRENDSISDELFKKYGVYRGLRDLNGKGVVTGLDFDITDRFGERSGRTTYSLRW